MEQCMRTAVVCLIVLFSLVACNTNPASSVNEQEIPETGDPERGALLFREGKDNAAPCASCHNETGVASPDLTGYGTVAGSRVEGESAYDYTFHSIVEPGRFIVEGYGNAMPNQYDEVLTPQEIADLIAYLLKL
jgi:mono/diheme cytochrome c family protein